MALQLPRIHRMRAVDAVYDVLRDRILSSEFQPGERLHIDDLAAKLGVSFTPIQHAIHRLTAEGLVEVRPRKGTFIASLSNQDVEEIFDIRCALECLAAEKAAVRITPDQLAALKQLLASLGRPVLTLEDRSAHERDNSEFHRAIVAASGNQRLLEIYQSLHAHLQISRVHAASGDGVSLLRQEHAEHVAIVEALERSDAAALVSTLRRHIRRAAQALSNSLNAR